MPNPDKRRPQTYLDLVHAVGEADPALADAAMRARDLLGLSAAALREEFRLSDDDPLSIDSTLRMAEIMSSLVVDGDDDTEGDDPASNDPASTETPTKPKPRA